LALSQTTVDNAQKALSDARASYVGVEDKAAADLASAYDGALTAAASGVVSGKSALVMLSDIQYRRFINANVTNPDLIQGKVVAMQKLFNLSAAGYWTAQNVSGVTSGVFGAVEAATSAQDPSTLDTTFDAALDALNAVSDALNAVPILDSFSTTDKTDLATQKTTIASAIALLSAKLQVVDVQKATNASVLASADASVTTAENALAAAQKALALQEAGSTPESITTQQSRIASAQAQKELVQAQIATMTLTSPIAGVVTSQNARKGVFMQAGAPVVSVISSGAYEIEAYVPEADIAKVSVGETADVTLDAYTDADIFKATVASIDPAETILQDVSTYKVTMAFVDGKDARIRSGMTANATILTDKRSNVIAVPTRAVITDGGQTYVRVVDNGAITQVRVTVGLRSSDGYTEITNGLSEGEDVVTFMRTS
jgi:HlyD family secretion protein